MICLSQTKCFQIATNVAGDAIQRRTDPEILRQIEIIKDGVLSATSFGVARDLMPQADRNSIQSENLRRHGAAGPHLTAWTDGPMMMTRFTAP
jgi:hypothetical protein